jgi:phosphatidylethanolamine/phosphatidyl-N-methylethanolamine N-methyltransferase
MPLRGTKIGRVLRQRREDAAIAWTFFRQWLKAPLTTAAVSPSSKELAAEMLSQLPDGARKVIELGGGTGVFTEALLERGIAPENLLVFELNESLHLHLMQRFPQTHMCYAPTHSRPRAWSSAKSSREPARSMP